jgi:hypothetical protein
MPRPGWASAASPQDYLRPGAQQRVLDAFQKGYGTRHRIPLGRKDSMPKPLWLDLMALLYFTNIATCAAIADAFDRVSHDQLTRMLNGSWSGPTLLPR